MKNILSIATIGILLAGCSEPLKPDPLNGSHNTDLKQFAVSVVESNSIISEYLNVTRRDRTIPFDPNDQVDIPPSEYIRPFPGVIHIKWTRYMDVGLVCEIPNTDKWITEACEITSARTNTDCYLILPSLYKDDEGLVNRSHLLDLFIHERGHCNGWIHPNKAKGL